MVVEKEQAKLRRLSQLKHNKISIDTAELRERDKKGEASQIVAEKLKFKSGRANSTTVSVGEIKMTP